MRVRCSQEEILGTIRCLCESDQVNRFGVSPLACLLMDDGGLPRDAIVSWIDKGIGVVQSIRDGTLAIGNWDREDWGAELKSSGVTIYSLNDENCSETISLESF